MSKPLKTEKIARIVENRFTIDFDTGDADGGCIFNRLDYGIHPTSMTSKSVSILIGVVQEKYLFSDTCLLKCL